MLFVIAFDHDLDVKVIKERLNARPRKTPVHEDDTVVFRIDKDELAGVWAGSGTTCSAFLCRRRLRKVAPS